MFSYITYREKRGVCDNYSQLAEMMLKIAGIPTVFIEGTVVQLGTTLFHAWNASYIDGKWLIFDVTWASRQKYENGEFYSTGNPTKMYFDISLNTASKARDILRMSYYPVPYMQRTVDIKVTKNPTKVHYINGDVLDLSGAVVVSVLRNGNHEVIQHIDLKVDGFNSSSHIYGQQTLTIEYEGFKTNVNVYLNRFVDVIYGHQAYSRINDLAQKGIINGYHDNTFRPNNNITRTQAAVMIVRALGIDYRGKKSDFTDVPSSHPSYEFISAAYQAGIISGYSIDNTFRPNDNITRQQIAVMIQRAFNVVHSGSDVSFSDVKSSMPSKSYIETLASQKIINGYSDGTFRPTNNTTRAQFSTMIYNALRYR